MSNGEVNSVELVPDRNYVEAATRGEVDMQVATAHRFPRSIKTFRERALSLATLDEDTAASCFYSLDRGGKPIEGPSARLAEIVAASWGNLRSQACVVNIDKKFVTARGTCWDLENNTAVSVEVQRRITDKQGRTYKDDMIGVTANAACSIALRNAVFKVVPMAMCKPIYDAARKVAIGDAQTLSSRRDKMVAYFAKMGVKLPQLLSKIEKASVEDITLDDLAKLIGLSTAIKDGDTTVDEAFPIPEEPKAPAAAGATKSDALADKLKTEMPDDRRTLEPKTTSEEKPKKVKKESDFKRCSEWLLANPDVKRGPSDPESGSMEFHLSDGVILIIQDKIKASTLSNVITVDTLEEDAFEQVKNNVERAGRP